MTGRRCVRTGGPVQWALGNSASGGRLGGCRPNRRRPDSLQSPEIEYRYTLKQFVQTISYPAHADPEVSQRSAAGRSVGITSNVDQHAVLSKVTTQVGHLQLQGEW